MSINMKKQVAVFKLFKVGGDLVWRNDCIARDDNGCIYLCKSSSEEDFLYEGVLFSMWCTYQGEVSYARYGSIEAVCIDERIGEYLDVYYQEEEDYLNSFKRN